MNKKKILSAITYAFFPKRCPFCRKVIYPDDDFCRECSLGLPHISYRRYVPGGFRCCAPLPYTGKYAKGVKWFKFSCQKDFAQSLALLIFKTVSFYEDMRDIDAVTCVPMHRSSLKERGFNQSELLARECAEMLGVPFLNTLSKCRQTPPQHTLKRSLRAENVKGAYSSVDGATVGGKHILLIDDVVTTGNTLGECARVLKNSGCRRVSCAAVCTALTEL